MPYVEDEEDSLRREYKPEPIHNDHIPSRGTIGQDLDRTGFMHRKWYRISVQCISNRRNVTYESLSSQYDNQSMWNGLIALLGKLLVGQIIQLRSHVKDGGEGL